MNNKSNIFKPNINKRIDNNKKIYYGNLTSENINKNQINKKNIKNYVINNKLFNKIYIITTKNEIYNQKIIDSLGNSIILSNGKIIKLLDIISIYEN